MIQSQTQSQDKPIETRAPVVCTPYQAVPNVYDEMWDQQGQARKHWAPFIDALEKMGCDELEKDHQEMIRLLRENGIAYNIHGDPQGIHRHYTADIVPLIFGREDWAAIEEGLKQRARLLDMILADIYGPRTLIREGIVPMELVFRHRGFLRPADKISLNGPQRLVICSSDLARGPDGQLRVMKDHTAKPIGIGYTLENRTAMANVLPDLFRDCKVLRLSNFFRTFRAEMAASAPFHREQPRVVILTPGPKDETYFEHAYLASYLGYPLVQGDDLTIRDGSLWLKSMEGLQPVDVVIRQVEDANVDSLEIASATSEGVAGYMEALRRGSFASVNIPGSRVLDNPGLMPFLPAVARHFLDEELLLPSVPTWWCGQPDALSYTLENLSRLVIKKIDSIGDNESVFGENLTEQQREELKARIQKDPQLFAGQETMRFSTAPSFIDGVFAPRHVAFRTFMVARQEGGYEVMPGGIARSVGLCEERTKSKKLPGILKDVWVIASQPQKHVSLWIETARPDSGLKRAGILTSRTAENLFWVGRYAERSDALIHWLRTVINLLSGSDRYGDEAEYECTQHLFRAMGRLITSNIVSPGPDGLYPRLDPGEQLRAAVLDTQKPGSLANTLQAMINAAYGVRDYWSNDTWQVVNSLESHRDSLGNISNFLSRSVLYNLNRIVTSLNAFTGLCMESMSREPGWMLLDIGRRIERSLMFIALIRFNLVERKESEVYDLLLESVLIAAENIITYRRRYRSYLDLETVLDLLLLDENNPRSLLYQLNRLKEHIDRLPARRDSHRLTDHERLVLKAWSRLRLIAPERLATISERSGKYKGVEGLLSSIKVLLERSSEAMSRAYFSHTQPSRALTSNTPGPVP